MTSKLCKIQMTLSDNEVLLEYSHPHSFMNHLCHATMAEVSHNDNDHMA